MSDLPPLIFTLRLERPAAERFTALRSLYFPKALNFLDAHLTLFHKIPAGLTEEMEATRLLALASATMKLEVTGLINLARGVAYRIACPALTELHGSLQHIWKDCLTGQDRQKLKPHITIQNKATPEEARQLQAKLAADFACFEFRGLGIDVHRYLGGPWEYLTHFPFRDI